MLSSMFLLRLSVRAPSSFQRARHIPLISRRVLPPAVPLKRNFNAMRRRRRIDRSKAISSSRIKKEDEREATNSDDQGNTHEIAVNSETPAVSRAVTDRNRFEAASDALLVKIYEAMRPLKPPLNENLILTRGIEPDLGNFLLISLGPADGQYTIQVDLEGNILIFVSPISGQMNYFLNERGEWVGTEDGHSFEGLLVRDLIRQIQGVPQL